MTFSPKAFQGRDTWIFDIDYTLYGPEAALFEQVVPRITEFVANHLNLPLDKARETQREYYLTYGSTMAGMRIHHAVDPHEFAGFVHDIDYSVLKPDPALRAAIAALPGRKLLFTNATMNHGLKVIANLGLKLEDFDGAFDVEMAGWDPKPRPHAYACVTEKFDIEGQRAVFFEDTLKNLETGASLGWSSVWVRADETARTLSADFTPDAVGTKAQGLIEQILKVV